MVIKGVNCCRNYLLILLIGLLLVPAIMSCSPPAEEVLSSDITKIPLDRVLGKGKPTLAEFGWRTCIPCKAMKPILEELAAEYKDKVNVIIVEVYDHEDLSRRYGIRGIPTQIFFDKDGKEVVRHAGYIGKEDILTLFSKIGVD